MSSLVLELQKDAIDSSVTVLALLRKALVVAKKLDVQALQHWVQNELDGYGEGSELPQYRFMYGELKARNPFRGWIPIIVPSPIHEFISNRPVHQPISEIESLIKNTKSGKNLSLTTMPPQLDEFLRMYGFIPYEMAVHIDRSQADGVLEAVRDVVLNWSLKLEENGILGEGMTFSIKEKEIAAQHDYSGFIQIINKIDMNNKAPDLLINNSPSFATHQTQGDTMSDKSSSFQFGNVGGDVAGIAGGDISGVAGKEMTGVAGGDISGTVTATIGQLAKSESPEAPKLADLLKQLQTVIEADTNLSEKDKAKALKQVQALAEAGQNPKDEDKKDLADNAITMLKGILSGVPAAAAFVEACKKLLPLIAPFFSL